MTIKWYVYMHMVTMTIEWYNVHIYGNSDRMRLWWMILGHTGSSSGTYGDMSLASATSAHMLPAIFAAFFFRSALRSRKPRVRDG